MQEISVHYHSIFFKENLKCITFFLEKKKKHKIWEIFANLILSRKIIDYQAIN